MKANIVMTIISAALACLIGYTAFCVAEGDNNSVLCAIFSTICFMGTLIPMMGLSYESGRLGINIRIISFLFLVVFLISHFCFAGFGVKMPVYLIVNGLILLIYFGVFYKFQGIKDV